MLKKNTEVVNISEPSLVEHYHVVADYKKVGAGEVNLRAGEVVDVMEKNITG